MKLDECLADVGIEAVAVSIGDGCRRSGEHGGAHALQPAHEPSRHAAWERRSDRLLPASLGRAFHMKHEAPQGSLAEAARLGMLNREACRTAINAKRALLGGGDRDDELLRSSNEVGSHVKWKGPVLGLFALEANGEMIETRPADFTGHVDLAAVVQRGKCDERITHASGEVGGRLRRGEHDLERLAIVGFWAQKAQYVDPRKAFVTLPAVGAEVGRHVVELDGSNQLRKVTSAHSGCPARTRVNMVFTA